ncbi:21712_t:CDS:2 [Entrophospora sp. SA101]|nr:21712_t:CDS:2 [Entrophospora sp. SA101]
MTSDAGISFQPWKYSYGKYIKIGMLTSNDRFDHTEKAAPGRHDDKCLRAITDLTIGEDKEATNRDDTVPNNRPLHT